MFHQITVLSFAMTMLSACTALPALAADRSTASAQAGVQYFYGARSIGTKVIASMLVKRTVDRAAGTITEQVTDCDHNEAAKQRVVPYRVEFKVRSDGFYTLEEVLQKSFRGTGQIKNDSWTAWTSHTYSPAQGWMLVSDDQITDRGSHGPSRAALTVKKIYFMDNQQTELAENFVDIDSDRYQTILDSYTKNAASSKLDCELE